MIEKSVGLLRNLFNKRKQIVEVVKKLALADDAIIIVNVSNNLSILGHTSSDAMSVFMLGTAIGLGYGSANQRDPDLSVDEYLRQPTSVALKQIERQGLL